MRNNRFKFKSLRKWLSFLSNLLSKLIAFVLKISHHSRDDQLQTKANNNNNNNNSRSIGTCWTTNQNLNLPMSHINFKKMKLHTFLLNVSTLFKNWIILLEKGSKLSEYIMGIVKTTTPFVNATTLVIWDFTRDVRVSGIKVISWRAGRGPLYEPFMAGEGLHYTRAGSRADIGGAQLMPLASCLNSGSPALGSCWARWLGG